jgi:hypothetical protein
MRDTFSELLEGKTGVDVMRKEDGGLEERYKSIYDEASRIKEEEGWGHRREREGWGHLR